MTNPAKAWQAIATLSAKLVTLAETGSWDRLEQELDKRNSVINKLLGEEIPAHQSSAVRLAVDQIRQHDQRLAELADSQRQQALAGLRQGSAGKKMQTAYAHTKRPY